MRQAGNTQQQIAYALGFSQSAISKELMAQRRASWLPPKAGSADG
ncbi:hypothetical protein ACFFOV_05440 [Cerasicoccus arenae]